MKLSQLGEDRLLERLVPGLPRNASVLAGAGDDCAVVRFRGAAELLVLKTDCVVQGIHFAKSASPRAVGWKAMARVLSDFAAMTAWPEFALVTLLAPSGTDAKWVEELYRGLGKAARAFGVVIVGGETSRTPGPLAVSVAMTGHVEKDRWISRRGGKAGDDLFVTGRLGGSLGGRHLRFQPRLQEARWLSEHFHVHAMMDLSDGLGADLPRLATASGVGFEIDRASLPRSRGCSLAQAIGDGEDYELLFALAPRDRGALERKWKRAFPKLRLTHIGRLNQKSEIRNQKWPAGYDHFQ